MLLFPKKNVIYFLHTHKKTSSKKCDSREKQNIIINIIIIWNVMKNKWLKCIQEISVLLDEHETKKNLRRAHAHTDTKDLFNTHTHTRICLTTRTTTFKRFQCFFFSLKVFHLSKWILKKVIK